MTVMTLYRFKKANGETVVTPRQEIVQEPYDTLSRLVADEGMILQKGEEQTYCIDVENSEVDQWEEVEAPEEDYED